MDKTGNQRTSSTSSLLSSIPVIRSPAAAFGAPVKNMGDFLSRVGQWQKKFSPGSDDGFLSRLWYRGVNCHFEKQCPGVYRSAFTERAKALKLQSKDIEDRRLHLERQMLMEFRTAGAMFLVNHQLVEIYFVAQHFGMPTRLLDWSTNPLVALFFTCDGEPAENGFVYAMDATKVIPDDAKDTDGKQLQQAVMTMRHPFVDYAVDVSFWTPPKSPPRAYVLPVRPDIIPGRIGQQNSCFTLHMHGAKEVQNRTLITFVIDAESKENVRKELHRHLA